MKATFWFSRQSGIELTEAIGAMVQAVMRQIALRLHTEFFWDNEREDKYLAIRVEADEKTLRNLQLEMTSAGVTPFLCSLVDVPDERTRAAVVAFMAPGYNIEIVGDDRS